MSLRIKLGPMFSGKTTWLNSEITYFSDIDLKVIRINFIGDLARKTNNSDSILTTHNSSYFGLTPKINCVAVNFLGEIHNIDKYDIVAIDEINFYLDLYIKVKEWLSIGKHIICVGLDGDFEQKSFGDVFKILPLADEFEKISANCPFCDGITHRNAPFTKRISSVKDQKVIGGKEDYVAVCRKHL